MCHYDGRVENQNRPIKFNRNNPQLSVHDENPVAWACITSLIETCKLNQVKPHVWLKATLEKLAAGHRQSRTHKLLPWAFKSAEERSVSVTQDPKPTIHSHPHAG